MSTCSDADSGYDRKEYSEIGKLGEGVFNPTMPLKKITILNH